MLKNCIVIPCYNEASRINASVFLAFTDKNPEFDLLFVNDGSTDNTLETLNKIKDHNPTRIFVLNKPQNSGKADTVRLGLLFAKETIPADYYAFLDADLATPIEEIIEFQKLLTAFNQYDVIFGSRIKRLGAKINRSELRHYLGRIFVTYSNLFIHIGAYDSQCGAKIFRGNIIESIFKEPFISPWLFDIEIVLRTDKSRILEFPVREWNEIGGSKLKMKDFLKAPIELLRIKRHYHV